MKIDEPMAFAPKYDEISAAGVAQDAANIALVELELRRKIAICMADYGLSTHPNLEILLDVFAGMHASKPPTLSDVAFGAGLASSSATRWIRGLEEAGFLTRTTDPTDRRRMYLHTTKKSENLISKIINLIDKRRKYNQQNICTGKPLFLQLSGSPET